MIQLAVWLIYVMLYAAAIGLAIAFVLANLIAIPLDRLAQGAVRICKANSSRLLAYIKQTDETRAAVPASVED